MNVCYQKNPDVPTGTCAVLIQGGERSLVTILGAANTFSPAHLQTPEAQLVLQKGTIFYISGFFLTVSIESILTGILLFYLYLYLFYFYYLISGIFFPFFYFIFYELSCSSLCGK